MCVRHFTHWPYDEVEGSVGSLSRFPELFCRTWAAPKCKRPATVRRPLPWLGPPVVLSIRRLSRSCNASAKAPGLRIESLISGMVSPLVWLDLRDAITWGYATVYERFLWQTMRATTYAKGNECVSTGISADVGRTQLASTHVVELGPSIGLQCPVRFDGAPPPVKPGAAARRAYRRSVPRVARYKCGGPEVASRRGRRVSGSRRRTAGLQVAEGRAKIAPGNGRDSCRISLRSSRAWC